MKSETSFFNFGIFRKNLTRFFPLWLVYTIGVLLIFLAINPSRTYIQRELYQSLSFMTVLNGAYGVGCAIFLFSDLFSAKRCNALHAMPLTRDCWFMTHVLSGLTFAAIPNLVLFLVQSARFPFVIPTVAVVCVGYLLEFLVFFGIAVFCVMLSGNLLSSVLLTGFVCLFSLLCYAFAETVYIPLLWGVRLTENPFLKFSPFILMASNFELPLEIWDGWTYLGIYSALSCLFLVGGWLLYRKRALECAGDFLAFHGLAPVLVVLVTPLCGGIIYAFFDIFGAKSYAYLFVGMAIVYFLLQMLLAGSLRVFRAKNIAWCAALCAMVGLSIFAMQFDPFGIASYIPDAKDVRNVQLNRGHYNDLEEESPREYVDAVRSLHAAILAEGEQAKTSKDFVYVVLSYKLKNGKTVERTYSISQNGEAAKILKAVTTRRKAVFGSINYWGLAEDKTYIPKLNDEIIAREVAKALLDAMAADCDAGNLCQIPELVDYQGEWVWLAFESVSTGYNVMQEFVLDVFVPSNAENTCEILNTLGFAGEYYNAKCGVDG